MVMKRLDYIVAGFIVVALASSVAFVLGQISGEMGANYRRFAYEERAIALVLAADPAFARVEIIINTSDGAACLLGEVPTESDLERLRVKMDNLLGTLREAKPLNGVSVAAPSSNPKLQRPLPAATGTDNSKPSLGGSVR